MPDILKQIDKNKNFEISGKEISDITIKDVVGVPDEEKISALRNAVQSLDSLSVMTIHSFCQKTIDEFTFESDQSFD